MNQEMKNDLFVWLQFLNNPVVYCRPFIDFTEMLIATDLEWSSDASGAIGFGVCIRMNGSLVLGHQNSCKKNLVSNT